MKCALLTALQPVTLFAARGNRGLARRAGGPHGLGRPQIRGDRQLPCQAALRTSQTKDSLERGHEIEYALVLSRDFSRPPAKAHSLSISPAAGISSHPLRKPEAKLTSNDHDLKKKPSQRTAHCFAIDETTPHTAFIHVSFDPPLLLL